MTKTRRPRNTKSTRTSQVEIHRTRSSVQRGKKMKLDYKEQNQNSDIINKDTLMPSSPVDINTHGNNDPVSRCNDTPRQSDDDDDIVILDLQKGEIRQEPTELFCYSHCEIGRLYDRAMIQCSTCMRWIHNECSDARKDSGAIWNCTKCRNLADNVDSLKQQLVEVHEILSVMVEKQNEFYNQMCELSSINAQLKHQVTQLKVQNHQLRLRHYNRLSSSSCSSSSDSDSSSSEEDEPRTVFDNNNITSNKRMLKSRPVGLHPKNVNNNNKSQVKKTTPKNKQNENTKPKVTLLGGSMVRNSGTIISANMGGVESTVYSVSGLTISKGTDVAKNVFASHTKNDIAVLQVGTSDVENSSVDRLCSRNST